MIALLTLGIIQGIAEWLPVSSEGLTLLISINVFGMDSTTSDLVRVSLFLHLGTFFAALLYFWKEVVAIVKSWFPLKNTGDNLFKFLFTFKEKNTLSKTDTLSVFIIYTTLISGFWGILFLYLLNHLNEKVIASAAIITGGIGVLLIFTGLLQLFAKKKRGTRDIKDLTIKDTVSVGIAQGLAALPGFSRSGFTTSTMLLSRIKEDEALHLSFLLSMPIVLLGNIVLNFKDLGNLTLEMLAALLGAFVFGFLSIHILLWVARKVNFGIFVILFGIVMIVYALFE